MDGAVEILVEKPLADRPEVFVFKIKEYLDAETTLSLETKLEETFKQEPKHLILDLSDLDYISSAGVGTCLGALEDIQARNGTLSIASLKENVRHVFELLGFLKIVLEFQSAAQALEKLPKK